MEKLTEARLKALDADHVRNLARMEQSNEDVLVHSSDIPGGYTVPPHRHRRRLQLQQAQRLVALVRA